MIKASILIFLQAMAMYLLVLGAHSLRRRYGQTYFYALLGGTEESLDNPYLKTAYVLDSPKEISEL